MATKTTAVTVTTTATRLDTATETDRRAGSSMVPYNNSAVTVYIGDASVTTSSGVPVAANSWGPSMDLDGAEAVYGIVASGTADVRVLEVGV